jgi:hypothetical protein
LEARRGRAGRAALWRGQRVGGTAQEDYTLQRGLGDEVDAESSHSTLYWLRLNAVAEDLFPIIPRATTIDECRRVLVRLFRFYFRFTFPPLLPFSSLFFYSPFLPHKVSINFNHFCLFFMQLSVYYPYVVHFLRGNSNGA